MCYVENTSCDSCDTIGLCIVIDGEFDDKAILCADCARIHEELETEFGQDDDCDEIDADDAWDDFDFTGVDAEYDYDSDEDDGDMYGDDFNPISQGMYDDE